MSPRKFQWISFIALMVMVVFLLPGLPAEARQYQTLKRISVNTGGTVEGSNVQRPAVNGDGTWIAYWSDKGGLVPNDTNFVGDVFLHNRLTGVTERVSLGFGGVQTARPGSANLPVTYSDISINDAGNLIAFASDATNMLNVADTNESTDIFVYDFIAKATIIASKPNAGNPQAAGSSYNPKLSGNGQFVLFRSVATNLVPEDQDNQPDIYIFDRVANAVALVNVSSGGQKAFYEDGTSEHSLSDDGLVVAFESVAPNLVAGDTNFRKDIFIRDRAAGTTTRIVGLGAQQGNGDSTQPFISGSGRYVTFVSKANNLVVGDGNSQADIFQYDRNTGTLTLISLNSEGFQANGGSARPVTSDNGRYIVFSSSASNLVPDDSNGQPDFFLHDRDTAITTRVNLSTSGQQANAFSGQYAGISDDGQIIAFESNAANLVPNDTNGSSDVFVAEGGPTSPNGLVVTNLTFGSVKLNWDDNSGDETSFVIQRRKPGTSTWGVRNTVGANIKTYTDSTGECKEWEYRVLSRRGNIDSPSNISTIRTLGCPPLPFDLLSPAQNETVINPARLQFRWQVSIEAATYTFTLKQGAATLDSRTVNAVDVCDDARCIIETDGALEADLVNGNFTWQVVATNTRGSTGNDATTAGDATPVPYPFTVNDTLPPTLFSLLSPTSNQMIRREEDLTTLTWRDNRDADTFDLSVINVSTNTRFGTVIGVNGLTPDSDGDRLDCSYENKLCTYTLNSVEQDAFEQGTYTWSVTAVSPGGGRTESRNSPQVFVMNYSDIELLLNGDFESDLDTNSVPDGWILTNPTNDTIKCGNGPNTGTCFFRFNGTAGVASTLKQTIENAYNIGAGDILDMNGFYKRSSVPANGFKIKVKVAYSDGSVTTKQTFTVPAGTGGYTAMPTLTLGVGSPVRKIKVQLTYSGASGRVDLDTFSLSLRGSSPRRSAEILPEGAEAPGMPLPLPNVPDGFQGSN